MLCLGPPGPRLPVGGAAVVMVAYCAPEQLLGEDIDGRADQYALAGSASDTGTKLRHRVTDRLGHHWRNRLSAAYHQPLSRVAPERSCCAGATWSVAFRWPTPLGECDTFSVAAL